MKIRKLLNASLVACATTLVACGGSGTDTQPQDCLLYTSDAADE